MTSITVETWTEVDIDLEEHREEIIAKLGAEAEDMRKNLIEEIHREYNLFGPAAAIKAVEDAVYESLGVQMNLGGAQ
ncbi:hypothetical protein [Neptuniibacter sp.]|uniref:hypothetical protein n=1 Tax=Neptuniibacter sp. TaxID=1962643 RepID=UPI0026238964|nr:hypothetical protein [Neptuniibacter sp.]MCP4597822.1 hypothetical protein [Neptuniibacter sp.]